jgi:hypothetical protein
VRRFPNSTLLSSNFSTSPNWELNLLRAWNCNSHWCVRLFGEIIERHLLYVLAIYSIDHEISNFDWIKPLVQIQTRTLISLILFQSKSKRNVYETRLMVFDNHWVFDCREVTFIWDEIDRVFAFKRIDKVWNHNLNSVFIIMPDNIGRDSDNFGGSLWIEEWLKN